MDMNANVSDFVPNTNVAEFVPATAIPVTQPEMQPPLFGKHSSFFAHQGVLSQEQMVFVFQHYPQYSMNPLEIVDWLFVEAQNIEYAEAMQREAYQRQQYQSKLRYQPEPESSSEEEQDTVFTHNQKKKKP